jgi:glycosyltransferase involved in cell wall biosynthesis
MKILFILPLSPWFRGGVENVVKEYSKQLQENNSITIVCTSPNVKEKVKFARWMNLEVIIFKSYGGVLRLSPGLVKYVQLNNRKFDILSLHNYSTLLPFQLLGRRNKIQRPIIFSPHFHSEGSTRLFKFFRLFLDASFRSFFVKKIDALHFVSKNEKNEFLRKFPNKIKSEIVYNGINTKNFQIEESVYESINDKIILCVGRLEQYKNIDFVIRTLKLIPIDYKLHIVGKGPYLKNLQNLVVENELQQRVEFLGSINNKEYISEMNRTGLLIQPSMIESFGLTILEAISSGKVSIVNTKAYGLQELLFLFKNEVIGLDMCTGNEKKLAVIIKENFGKKIKSERISEFDWQNQGIKLENYFQSVLKKQ